MACQSITVLPLMNITAGFLPYVLGKLTIIGLVLNYYIDAFLSEGKERSRGNSFYSSFILNPCAAVDRIFSCLGNIFVIQITVTCQRVHDTTKVCRI